MVQELWCDQQKCDPTSNAKIASMLRRVIGNMPEPEDGADLLEWLKHRKTSGESRRIVGGPLDQTTKKLPPRRTMAKNVAKFAKDAVVKLATKRRVYCCDEQRQRRWATCQKCGHMSLVKGKERCMTFPGDKKKEGCGCYLRQKIKFAASNCDVGWTEIDNQYEVT